MEMLAGGALLLCLGVLGGEGRQLHLWGVAFRSLLGLIYLIGFGSLLGFTAYIWLLRTVSTVRLATYAFVNPAVAVFLGWALGNELFTGRELLASATIIAGVALIITHRPTPIAIAPETEGLRLTTEKSSGKPAAATRTAGRIRQ
jgi:drug/metabolite transporter (DMT)-like permease